MKLLAFILIFGTGLSAHAGLKVLGPFKFFERNNAHLDWVLEDDRNKAYVKTICPRPGACVDIYRGSVWYFLHTDDPVIAGQLDEIRGGTRVRIATDRIKAAGTYYEDPKYSVHVTQVGR